MVDYPARRFIPFSVEMSDTLEKLHLTYPAISRAQISAEALRRGMNEMISMGSPTLLPGNVIELRRVG